MVRQYPRPDSSIGQQPLAVAACMSDTVAYMSGVDGISAALGTGCSGPSGCPSWSGNHYSYTTNLWMQAGGLFLNYYDEVLAHYMEYFASGLNLFRDNARAIGDYWMGIPAMDDGYVIQEARNTSLVGPIVASVLDNTSSHNTDHNWLGIRNRVNQAIVTLSNSASACGYQRETGYRLWWVGLDALLDPDVTPVTGQRAIAKAALDTIYPLQAGCITTENVGTSFYGSSPEGSAGTFTAVNGSPVLTGTGFTTALCPQVATGTIASVNPGDTNLTGTGFVSQPSGKIVISGARSSVPYRLYSSFTYIDIGIRVRQQLQQFGALCSVITLFHCR